MNAHLTYLAVDLGCLIVPFLFSFHPKLAFHRQFKSLFFALIGMMAVFLPWDIWFTAKQVWHFNYAFTTGISFFNLPLEEVLFFACIPFSCLFTWHCIRIFFADAENVFIRALTWLLILINITLIILFYQRAYTVGANMISAITLGYFLRYHRVYLKNILLTWTILLIPFFVSNGILTGLNFYSYSLLNLNLNPANYIVGYNNAENLGVRIWSVPLEDFFYGLGMYALTIAIYLKHQSRFASSTTTAR